MTATDKLLLTDAEGAQRLKILTGRLDDTSVEARTIYVYNAAKTVTGENLEQLFNYCGRIKEVKHCYDKNKQTFVWQIEFERPESARTACCLDGTKILESEIQIVSPKYDVALLRKLSEQQREANQPKKEDKNQGQLLLTGPTMPTAAVLSGASLVTQLGYDPANPPEWLKLAGPNDREQLLRTIYVGNLPPTTTYKVLSSVMSRCGPVSAARIAEGTDQQFRWGVVEFVGFGPALSALAHHGMLMKDRQIIVMKSQNILDLTKVRAEQQEEDRRDGGNAASDDGDDKRRRGGKRRRESDDSGSESDGRSRRRRRDDRKRRSDRDHRRSDRDRDRGRRHSSRDDERRRSRR